MDLINRSAIVVRPRQPFLNWLQRVDPTSAYLALDDLRRQPTIYLLPECDSKEQALEFLREISREIFEEQLNGWHRVASVWPSGRDLATIRIWFEIGFHTTIVDLCDDPVEHDEL